MAKQTTYKQLTSTSAGGGQIARKKGTTSANRIPITGTRTSTNRATGKRTTTVFRGTPVTKDEFNGTGRMSEKKKRIHTQR